MFACTIGSGYHIPMDEENKFYESNRFKGGGGTFLPKERPRSFALSDETPKLIQWLLLYSGGLIKDKNQALYVLWALVVAGFIISFYFLSSIGGEPPAGEDPSILLPSNELLL